MNYEYLDKINSIEDVKKLPQDSVDQLCDEIRHFLVDKVGQNGGHLASNLGVVELSVALHRVFDSPKDHIIFDVGHQSYVHKILTGRRDDFDTLRKPGGLSGFTSRRESEHDAFSAGHSSTSISAALGFAESDKLLGKDNYTVAVVGDGAFTGGMIHEAINNCKQDLKLIVILNENGMSISINKGAFATYLSEFRMSKGYLFAKNSTRSILGHIPLVGKPMISCAIGAKNMMKRLVYKTNYFEDLGFYYICVKDGNNEKKLEKALKKAKALNKCVFVHIKTKKGKGLADAESSPEKYHSIVNGMATEHTFHTEFADALIELSGEKDDAVAVTAAMGIGTGLSDFESKYPKRYFDVGIAESHALTFSAGLAANGLKPFCAIYSTFLQRGYDNILHDVALQSLPVKMFIDRAGLAVSDGATHHGIFDVAFLSHIPNVQILAPSDYNAMRHSVRYAYNCDGPIAVRYSNTAESQVICDHFRYLSQDNWIKLDFDPSDPPKNIFLTYGTIAEKVVEAKKILDHKGTDVGIVLIERIKPYLPTVEFIKTLVTDGTHFVYVEEGIKLGGAGVNTREMLGNLDTLPLYRFDVAAIDDQFAYPDSPCDLYDYVGLSAQKIANYFDK